MFRDINQASFLLWLDQLLNCFFYALNFAWQACKEFWLEVGLKLGNWKVFFGQYQMTIDQFGRTKFS